MKQTLFLLLMTAMVSCKQKEPTKADFMSRARQHGNYMVVKTNFQRVKDSLDKKQITDTNAVIYEYNFIADNGLPQVKTMAQVKSNMADMERDSSFLKSVQTHIAAGLEKAHQDSLTKK